MNANSNKDGFSFSGYVPSDKPNMEQWEAAIISKCETGEISRLDALYELLEVHGREGDLKRARRCADMIVESTDRTDYLAKVYLALGCFAEQERDYLVAVNHYTKAAGCDSKDSTVSYWVHNNLGYSLNQLGRYRDAEQACKIAIGIEPRHANAFKNLGLSYLYQERLEEAAQSFINATKANASDSRSLKYLEQLYKEHPEIRHHIDKFPYLLRECRRWVKVAAAVQQGFNLDYRKNRRPKGPL